MGGEFHKLVMAALAAGLLVIPGCGAGAGGGQNPTPAATANQPKIVAASLEGTTALRVTYSEPVQSVEGVDPGKFRLTVAYFTRPASGSDKYNYGYYTKGYSYGYGAADHTIYSEVGHPAGLFDGSSPNESVLQIGSTFDAAASCKQIAALNAANPNAHAGLYLHYSEAGSPTVQDADGNKVASLAAYWNSDPTIEQISGDFVGKPIPVAITCP